MRFIRTLIIPLIISCNLHSYSQKTVKFIVRNIPNLQDGEVGIRGSISPLSWDNSISVKVGKNGYEAVVQFPDSAALVEFKFVVRVGDRLRWEGTENRVVNLNTKEDTIVSINEWEVEQVVDVASLDLLYPEDLIKDYFLIEEMVLNVHPGTYRYNSKEEIDDALGRLKSKFQDTLTHGEAYLAISELLASLQCDHTYASFFNQNKIIKSVIHWQKNKLPFAFKWIDNRMIVTYSAIDQVSKGQEIQSIDGKPAQEIGETLLKYVSADGETNKSRWSKLQVHGYDFRWSAFDVFYPLVFPITQDSVEVEIFDFNTKGKKRIQIPLVTLDERWKQLVHKYPDFPNQRDDLLSFRVQDKVGIIKLGSFASFGWKKLEQDYELFFADTFQKIKDQNIDYLIVDMRENTGGGDEMAREFFTYFDIDRITIDDRVGKTRFIKFPEKLKSHCQTWGNPWYYEMNPEKEEGDYYIFTAGAQVNRKNEKKASFYSGKSYWLTSPANVSLAYYTAKSVRKYQLGPLIGEETGGNLKGINGGQILFLRLPNTQIEIDFPVMGDFNVYDQPNHGVKPDYQVKTEPKDILMDRDRQVEFTLNLINQNR